MFLSIVDLGFPGGSAVKNPPTMQEMWVPSLGQEDPLKDKETHSSFLAWRIPWTESLVGYSPQGFKESKMTEVTQHEHTHIHII